MIFFKYYLYYYDVMCMDVWVCMCPLCPLLRADVASLSVPAFDGTSITTQTRLVVVCRVGVCLDTMFVSFCYVPCPTVCFELSFLFLLVFVAFYASLASTPPENYRVSRVLVLLLVLLLVLYWCCY